MSRPPTRIWPPTLVRLGLCRPSTARLATLLPEPDSPTMPRVRPGSTVNETPLTARTVPSSVWKRTVRSRTSRYGVGSGTSTSSGSSKAHARRPITTLGWERRREPGVVRSSGRRPLVRRYDIDVVEIDEHDAVSELDLDVAHVAADDCPVTRTGAVERRRPVVLAGDREADRVPLPGREAVLQRDDRLHRYAGGVGRRLGVGAPVHRDGRLARLGYRDEPGRPLRG